MHHIVPKQMFSTDESPAHGISAVKALAIASQQGQKIWNIDHNNWRLAQIALNLPTDTLQDIENAVYAGQVVTAHEEQILFHGWVGEGYIILDPQTGGGAYMIAGGGNGSQTISEISTALTALGIVMAVAAFFSLVRTSFALIVGGSFMVIAILDVIMNCNLNNPAVAAMLLAMIAIFMLSVMMSVYAIMFGGVAMLAAMVALSKLVALVSDIMATTVNLAITSGDCK